MPPCLHTFSLALITACKVLTSVPLNKDPGSEVSCPRPRSWQAAEPGSEPRSDAASTPARGGWQQPRCFLVTRRSQECVRPDGPALPPTPQSPLHDAARPHGTAQALWCGRNLQAARQAHPWLAPRTSGTWGPTACNPTVSRLDPGMLQLLPPSLPPSRHPILSQLAQENGLYF